MKYWNEQSTQGSKNFLRSKAHGRGSATGKNNNIFVEKGDGWVCSLCYESVRPMTQDVNGFYSLELHEIDLSKKILWVNTEDGNVHRKQSKKNRHNTFNYVCIMSHFIRKFVSEYPIDNNGCCNLCKTKLLQIKHPVYINKKVYVNMKDSKVHFRRHNLKWICIR